jgi:hypothetical protein
VQVDVSRFDQVPFFIDLSDIGFILYRL